MFSVVVLTESIASRRLVVDLAEKLIVTGDPPFARAGTATVLPSEKLSVPPVI
jgi:hypothetical protein